MSLEINTAKITTLSSTQDFNFDIYDLYNRQSRINALESLLCYLVKENKPIDNCLAALNHLESKSVKTSEKPKQTIPQIIAEAAYNAFAIIGAFVIISCLYKAPDTNYSSQVNPLIQQGELNQVN